MNNGRFFKSKIIQLESIYLQYRLITEQFYFSYIISRKKEFEETWSKHNKYLTPNDIRKYIGEDGCDEFFPHPIVWERTKEGKKTKWIERPIQEKEFFAFYNRTHKLLHEQNPYKVGWEDRISAAPKLLQEAFDMLRVLHKLFSLHQRVSVLSTGEKHLMMSQFMLDGTVSVCSILQDSKEQKTQQV